LFRSTGVLDEFGPDFVEKFRFRFKSDFGMDYRKADRNAFWFCYIYLVNHFPAPAAIARNFLHMYSFARNMATACFLLIAFAFLAVYIFASTAIPQENIQTLLAGATSVYVIGLIMLLRYFYLYSSYFTRFVFRAYTSGTQSQSFGGQRPAGDGAF